MSRPVKVRVIGYGNASQMLSWPEDWPVPSLGEQVALQDGISYAVTTVIHYPEGLDADAPKPYIYVVARRL